MATWHWQRQARHLWREFLRKCLGVGEMTVGLSLEDECISNH
jgi:hypothetical protein